MSACRSDTIRPRVRLTTTALLLLTVAIASLTLATAPRARADSQWMSLYDLAQTYRNNYDSSGSCWDQYNSFSNCYQGTWASTEYTYCYCSGSYSVYETPDRWDPTIPFTHNSPFYWYHKSGIYGSYAPGWARTNGADYDSLRDHHVDHNAGNGRRTVHENLDTFAYAYTSDD